MLWRRAWQPTPVFLPGESHGQRSLVDYSAWGCKRVRHDSITKHMYVLSSNQMDTKIDLKSLKTMFNKEQNAIEWIWTSEWNGLYSNPSPSLLALRCSVAYLLSASVQKKKKKRKRKASLHQKVVTESIKPIHAKPRMHFPTMPHTQAFKR